MAGGSVPHGGRAAEATFAAVALGLVLSVVMGAANVYLGLRAGMTVSASIPAAVVGLALINGVLRRKSILESNIVQTTASAGEALAAGIIFTMPALLLTNPKIWQTFDYATTTAIAAAGGVLGALLMIPMRRVFIVGNPDLPFPEGVACAAVLRTGESVAGGSQRTASGIGAIAGGLLAGGLLKFGEKWLGLYHGMLERATVVGGRVFTGAVEVSPALIAVGAVVGLPVAAQVFLGGALGWLGAIPLLSAGTATDDPLATASALWKGETRYIGVGTMVFGGLVSIWKVRGGLLHAVRDLASRMTSGSVVSADRREQDIEGKWLLLLTASCVLLIGGVYRHLLGSLGLAAVSTVAMIVMAFFLTAVASYIVGLVGSSNSPVSGMTITAVLGTGGLLWVFRHFGWLPSDDAQGAILATLGVAGVVCCVVSTAGDTCNDLKTGNLLGASPRVQQWCQLGGTVLAAFVMAPVMTVLHEGSLAAGTGGIGGKDLPAPQAKLFAALADGIFGTGDLPWNRVGTGMLIGAAILGVDQVLRLAGSRFRLHVMPVAVGIYLPFGTSTSIFLGGLAHWILSTLAARRGGEASRTAARDRAVLLASGLIAGESLCGVLLGFLAWSQDPQEEASPTGLLVGVPGRDGAAYALSACVACGLLTWIVVDAVRASRGRNEGASSGW